MGDADRLPMANVSRIVQGSLPKDAAIAKEARVALSACATVFVHYITELAVQQCDKRKKVTLTPEDIVEALREAEFEDFEQPMKDALAQFRNGGAGAKKGGSSAKKQKVDDGSGGGAAAEPDVAAEPQSKEGEGEAEGDEDKKAEEDKMEEEDVDEDKGKDEEVENQDDAEKDAGKDESLNDGQDGEGNDDQRETAEGAE